jgi:hypothetical protein
VERAGEGFGLRSADGQRLEANRVILAAGGQSVPKTGSDGHGYALAGAFGHSIVPTYPALVPLTSPDGALKDLAGISLPVRWRARTGGKVREERTRELLFTHRGFSGPAILDASHWVVRDGARIEVAWNGLDRTEWQERFAGGGRREVLSVVAELLPRRLAQTLVARVPGVAELPLAHFDRRRRELLLDALCDFELPVGGNEGFRVAEVTGGGVPLSELDPKCLESRKAPGLFLCGEILDVVGRIGGYNFLWAWVTGRLAGQWAGQGQQGRGKASSQEG